MALDMLRTQARIRFDEHHALSGGSWGLAMSMFSRSRNWCEALKQSLKAEKSKLDPRRLTQTSHKVFGPRSAQNPFANDIEWWKYWYRHVKNFTNGRASALFAMPGPAKIFVHVAQLLKEGGDKNQAVNDCWFTNQPNDLQCLFDPTKPKVAYASSGSTPVSYKTNTTLLNALTYSSAAWSTLQAKVGVKHMFRQKCPRFRAAGLDIELTDGGDFMNLPLMSVVNEFHLRPQNTQVLAFDFTEPAAGPKYGNPPNYDVRYSIEQLTARSPFRGVHLTVIDKCQAKLVYRKGAHTLTIHILGFCGPARYSDGGGPETLIKKFRTLSGGLAAAGKIATGKGLAKQWNKAELHLYMTNYGAFLTERLPRISTAQLHVPRLNAPILCNPY